MEQSGLGGKNYYKILRVSPEARRKEITANYKLLAALYQHLLSIMPDVPVYLERMAEIKEAYEVLSNSAERAAYDQVFQAEYKSQEAEAEEPTIEDIADSIEFLAQEVAKRKKRMTWGVPNLSKIGQRAVLTAIVVLLLLIAGGSSFAVAQPEHTLAAPFKDVAITVAQASSAAISLIEDIRGVVAIYECNIVSKALQSMRVIENLGEVRPLVVPTNDMACFPSAQHSLFPDYLDKRYSQFKYMVDSRGVASVDTSGATTDAFLKKIERFLDRVAEGE